MTNLMTFFNVVVGIAILLMLFHLSKLVFELVEIIKEIRHLFQLKYIEKKIEEKNGGERHE